MGVPPPDPVNSRKPPGSPQLSSQALTLKTQFTRQGNKPSPALQHYNLRVLDTLWGCQAHPVPRGCRSNWGSGSTQGSGTFGHTSFRKWVSCPGTSRCGNLQKLSVNTQQFGVSLTPGSAVEPPPCPPQGMTVQAGGGNGPHSTLVKALHESQEP